MTPSPNRAGTAARGWIPALALLLPLLAGVLGAMRHLPPQPLGANASADQFSAGRAMVDVETIARAPHPIGSAENRRVREYIVQRLRELGLNPEVQQAIGVNRPGGVAARVANIVARKPGRGREDGRAGKAIMLVAHYDSVPTGPGASDDGAGVAAILEAARWLGAAPALRNDVILLFTDGEEFGLLGAEAFVAHHRWSREVGLVVNLEARGHTGPSMLFETSPANAALIEGAARGVPTAVANSLTYEVYKRLPNDTDFTVFKRAAMAGVNLAYLGGVTHYHTALDSPANVDRASLQHHGEYLTGLLRAFGDAELPPPALDDAIYFPAPLRGIIQYDPALALPLALIGCLLAGVLVWQAWRIGWLAPAPQASARRPMPGARTPRLAPPARLAPLAPLASLAFGMLRVFRFLGIAAFAGWALWSALRWANPNYQWLSNGDGYRTDLLFYGLIIFTAAGAVAGTGRHPADRVACWLVWALLALCSALLVPGASWLFAWPLLAGALAEGVASRAGVAGASVCRAVGLMPLAFLATPISLLLFTALGPAKLPAILVFAGLCLLPFVPLLESLRGGALYGVLVVAGAASAGTGLALSGFNPEARKANHVIYLLERDVAAPRPPRARWYSGDEVVDAWTMQFLGTDPASEPLPELSRSRPVLQAPAPILDLPLPRLTITDDTVAGGMRRLTVHAESPADVVILRPDGDSAIRTLRIEGAPLFDARDGQPFRRLQIVAPGAHGVDLALELPTGKALRLQIIQQFWGLPATAEFAHVPRSSTMMTAPLRQADNRMTLDRWNEGVGGRER
ncbi:MAG: M20/M25/M40 family metallo-hydrolase [Betaproteobacteria bacterium]